MSGTTQSPDRSTDRPAASSLVSARSRKPHSLPLLLLLLLPLWLFRIQESEMESRNRLGSVKYRTISDFANGKALRQFFQWQRCSRPIGNNDTMAELKYCSCSYTFRTRTSRPLSCLAGICVALCSGSERLHVAEAAPSRCCHSYYAEGKRTNRKIDTICAAPAMPPTLILLPPPPTPAMEQICS